MNDESDDLAAAIRASTGVGEREAITGLSAANVRVTVRALRAVNILLALGSAALIIAIVFGWVPLLGVPEAPPDIGAVLAVTAAAALVGGLWTVAGAALAGIRTRDRIAHVVFFAGAAVVPWVARLAFFVVLAQVLDLPEALVILAAAVLVTADRLLVQLNEATLVRVLESDADAAHAVLADIAAYRRRLGITGDSSSSGIDTVRLVWCILWWAVSAFGLALLALYAPLLGAGVVLLALALEWPDHHRPNDHRTIVRNQALVALASVISILVALLAG